MVLNHLRDFPSRPNLKTNDSRIDLTFYDANKDKRRGLQLVDSRPSQ